MAMEHSWGQGLEQTRVGTPSKCPLCTRQRGLERNQLTLKPNWHNWSRVLIGVIQPPCAMGASGQSRPCGVDAPSSGPRGSQKCPVPAAPTAQCERGMSQHWALVFVSWRAWAASHPPSGCPVSASAAWGWQKSPEVHSDTFPRKKKPGVRGHPHHPDASPTRTQPVEARRGCRQARSAVFIENVCGGVKNISTSSIRIYKPILFVYFNKCIYDCHAKVGTSVRK